MKNIEKALGYELERNPDGGVFLQKEELARINAKLIGKWNQVVQAGEGQRLRRKLKEQSAKVAQLERQIKTLQTNKSKLLTKAELEHYRTTGTKAPTEVY